MLTRRVQINVDGEEVVFMQPGNLKPVEEQKKQESSEAKEEGLRW